MSWCGTVHGELAARRARRFSSDFGTGLDSTLYRVYSLPIAGHGEGVDQMKIAQRYTYTHDGLDVEVELRIAGDHEVEVDEIFAIVDASGEQADVSDAVAAEMEKAINGCLESEGHRGEWNDVIDETRIDAEQDEPEPTWGYGAWAPKLHSDPAGHRVH